MQVSDSSSRILAGLLEARTGQQLTMSRRWRIETALASLLRERLKEAKGIGTPATRAEIIGGLKKQSFLMAQGKHIVPTETGLSLFGVLKQADPALVDPGVTGIPVHAPFSQWSAAARAVSRSTRPITASTS